MPRIKGIYAAICKPIRRLYLGRSVDVPHRWARHRWELNRGIHFNSAMQRDWLTYGREAFEFRLVSACAACGEADLDAQEARLIEQAIKELGEAALYNTHKEEQRRGRKKGVA